MREIEWRSMDKDKIIDLILDHNVSVDTLTADIRRRIQGKLENMEAAALWRHIDNVYDGKLYGPDISVIDEREVKRRELALKKTRNIRETTEVHSAPMKQESTFTMIDSAHNDLYAKKCVRKIWQYGEQLVIIMEDSKMIVALRKYILRKYPGLWVTIIGEESNDGD
jgi:hypothetical protein